MVGAANTVKKIIKILGFILSMLIACLNFTDDMIAARAFDGAVFTNSTALCDEGAGFLETLRGSTAFSARSIGVSSSTDETLSDSSLRIKFLKLIDAASIDIYESDRAELAVRGDAIGISIRTDGVIVVGFGGITLSSGETVCPAKRSGLRAGDVIKKLNGNDVCTANELQLALNSSSGAVYLSVERSGKTVEIKAEPVFDDSCSKRLGVWVRDSTIGIGTLSFSDESSGCAAALGHAVLDADTQTLIPVLNGSMVYADILGVIKGRSGTPGELKGTFSSKSEAVGTVERNGVFGVFGKVALERKDGLSIERAELLPVAFPDEVHTGEALIYSQLDSDAPQRYSCRIIRTIRQKSPDQKGLVIEITDPRLIDAAGGIVQGMSGSPIIQDGMIAGVVTHVFINDPSKGYGAYAFWIHQAMIED